MGGPLQAASWVLLFRVSGWEEPGATLSSRWDYKLSPLSKWSRGGGSLKRLFVCSLDSNQPAPQVPWLNGATGLCSSVDQLCPLYSVLELCWLSSFQVSCLIPLVRWGQELHFAGSNAMTQLPFLGGGRSELLQLRAWIRQTCVLWVPCQTELSPWLCSWTKLLIGTTAWTLQVGNWSAKI